MTRGIFVDFNVHRSDAAATLRRRASGSLFKLAPTLLPFWVFPEVVVSASYNVVPPGATHSVWSRAGQFVRPSRKDRKSHTFTCQFDDESTRDCLTIPASSRIPMSMGASITGGLPKLRELPVVREFPASTAPLLASRDWARRVADRRLAKHHEAKIHEMLAAESAGMPIYLQTSVAHVRPPMPVWVPVYIAKETSLVQTLWFVVAGRSSNPDDPGIGRCALSSPLAVGAMMGGSLFGLMTVGMTRLQGSLLFDQAALLVVASSVVGAASTFAFPHLAAAVDESWENLVEFPEVRVYRRRPQPRQPTGWHHGHSREGTSYRFRDESPNSSHQQRQQTNTPPPATASLSIDAACKILSCKPSDGPTEVKRAFRRAARLCHPDRFTTDPPEAQVERRREFQRLVNAYEKLLATFSVRRRK